METKKGDVIHHRTITYLSFVDCLCILIGGKVITESDIEVQEEVVHITKSVAKTFITLPSWFPRKRRKLITSNSEQDWSANY